MRNLVETAKEILSEAVVDTTKPKTEKEKKLAAMGHPKDKITHKDVLIGRGVLTKEQKEKMDDEMEDDMDDDMKYKKKKKTSESKAYSFYVQSYLQEEGLESLSQIDNTELHVAMDIIEMAYQQQVESFDQLDEVSVVTMIRAKAAAKKKAAKAEEEGDEAEVMKRSSQAAKFDTAAKKKFAQNK
jgi:hypothetical protein